MGRKERKDTKGIVYLISFPNNKKYVGITTTSLKERKRNHMSERASGLHLPVHNALKKYEEGVSWEVIDKANNWTDLCELEKHYIAKYKSHIDKNGYNLTFGGDGTIGYKHSDERNKENSARRKIYFSNFENRKKQSRATLKAHQENPKQAKEHSEFMKEYYSDGTESEKRKKEMEDYLSIEENLIKHSIQRGAKKFMVYDSKGKFIGEWLTQSQCARDLELNVSHINQCLHGNRKTHMGYRFKFKGKK